MPNRQSARRSTTEPLGPAVEGASALTRETTAMDPHRRSAEPDITTLLPADLAADICHALRAPLTALAAARHAVADGLLTGDEAVSTCLADLEDQARRLARMADDLLAVCTSVAPSLAVQPQPWAVDLLVAEALAAAAGGARRRGVRLQATVPDGTPRILAWRSGLVRALHNLLDNAVQATRAGGTVQVVVGMGPAGVVIGILDECGSVSDAQLGDLRRRVGGPGAAPVSSDLRGLGLPLARMLVAAHGGMLEVARAGSGCCVQATFPR